MKMSFLKGSQTSKNSTLKNLQKKFNIDDNLIQPFPEPPLDNKYDEKYVRDILNKEKELKESMKRKAIAASFKAKEEANQNQRSSMYFTIGLANVNEKQEALKHSQRKQIAKLERILYKVDPMAIQAAHHGVLQVKRD